MEAPPDSLTAINVETRTPPKTRVKTAEGLRAILQRAIRDDEPRNKQRSIVKGCIDGNPPYNEGRRRANGLTWTANLNFMEGEGIMDSSGVPYYQIFSGVEYYAETRTAYQPEHPDHERWHAIIAKHFHCMLKRWTGFDWHMQQASYQMRLHGLGPVIFDRKGDWRFRSLASGSVLAPQGASSAVDERLTFLIFRVAYRIHELWGFIRESLDSTEEYTSAGWNVEMVKNTILSLAKTGGGTGEAPQEPNWEAVQEQLKHNDLQASYTDCDTVACAHVVVQEFSGKISHFILTEAEFSEPKRSHEEKKESDFLFRDLECYDGYEQFCTVFFQNIGDGTWHSVRGLATKSFKHLEVSNRLKNRMVDGAFIESSLTLKMPTNKTKDAMQLTQIGPVTYLPKDAEPIQGKLSGFLDGPMTVDRLISNHLSNNIGMFQQRTLSREDGRGEVPTATQIDAQVNKESSLGQGQMSLFYCYLDRVESECFRRSADPSTSDKEAKRFQKACKDDGVPMAALKNMEYVRANRASGYGSPQMRQLTDQQMMPFIGMLPEDGKHNFLEDAVAGIKGADKVRRYVPREHIPNNDDWQVSVENSMMEQGNKPQIAAGQNPVVHLHGHLQFTADKILPLKEAMDAGESDPQAIQAAYPFVQVMAVHLEEHLSLLSGDQTRKPMVRMFQDQIAAIVGFSGQLRGAIKQAQREARLAAEQDAQATALSAMDAAKVQSVQTDIQLNAAKTASKIQNDRLKVANKARLDRIKTLEDIRLTRAKEDAAPELVGAE